MWGGGHFLGWQAGTSLRTLSSFSDSVAKRLPGQVVPFQAPEGESRLRVSAGLRWTAIWLSCPRRGWPAAARVADAGGRDPAGRPGLRSPRAAKDGRGASCGPRRGSRGVQAWNLRQRLARHHCAEDIKLSMSQRGRTELGCQRRPDKPASKPLTWRRPDRETRTPRSAEPCSPQLLRT